MKKSKVYSYVTNSVMTSN